MIKIFLFLYLIIQTSLSFAQITCPSADPVRIDVGKKHPMAPKDKRGRKINGNLKGARVTNQMNYDNCYAHSAAIVYKSLSPRNPYFDPLALSTCLSDDNLTITNGNLERVLECNKGKRYCTIPREDTLYGMYKDIDNAREYIESLDDNQKDKFYKVLDKITTKLDETGYWNHKDFSNCLKSTPSDNLLKYSVRCNNKIKDAKKILKSTKKLILRLKKRSFLKADILSLTPSNDSYCVKTNLYKLYQLLDSIQKEYKKRSPNLKEIRKLRKQTLKEIDRIILNLDNVISYPKTLVEFIDSKSSIEESTLGLSNKLKSLELTKSEFIDDVNEFKKLYDSNCNQSLIKTEDIESTCDSLNISNKLIEKIIPLVTPLVEWSNSVRSLKDSSFKDSGKSWIYNVLNLENQNVYNSLNKCKGKRKHKFPDLTSKLESDNAYFSLIRESDPLKRELLLQMANDLRDDLKIGRFVDLLLKNLPSNISSKYSTLKNTCQNEIVKRQRGQKTPNKCMNNIEHLIKNILDGTDNSPTVEPIDELIESLEEDVILEDIYKRSRDTFSMTPSFRGKRKQKSKSLIQKSLENIKSNHATLLSVCALQLKSKTDVKPNTKLKYFNPSECGNHGIAAIGYKCEGSKLKVLIQNSWGTDCSSNFSYQSSIECEKDPKTQEETGKFWIEESTLNNILLATDIIKP